MPENQALSRTTRWLTTSTGEVLKLRPYRFPESYEKFNIFVDGERTQAARTAGIGAKGDIRHYTYIKYNGISLYVKAWLDRDTRVQVTEVK
jgi:hypothetical protein